MFSLYYFRLTFFPFSPVLNKMSVQHFSNHCNGIAINLKNEYLIPGTHFKTLMVPFDRRESGRIKKIINETFFSI